MDKKETKKILTKLNLKHRNPRRNEMFGRTRPFGEVRETLSFGSMRGAFETLWKHPTRTNTINPEKQTTGNLNC